MPQSATVTGRGFWPGVVSAAQCSARAKTIGAPYVVVAGLGERAGGRGQGEDEGEVRGLSAHQPASYDEHHKRANWTVV